MAEWNFNRGEWTEAYVFLRLLGDGRIYGANDELKKDELTYLDIVNIIRDEPTRYIRFQRFMAEEVASIEVIEGEARLKIVTAPELQEKAQFLYTAIKALTAEKKTSIPEIEEYLKEMNFTSPKANLSDRAKELYGAKADIILTVQDSLDQSRSIVGFSIKSHIGSSPTLFNCSSTSGFRYKLINCNEQIMHELNNLDSYKTIIATIRDRYGLESGVCRNDVFAANICVVDSQMEKVLSTAALINSGYYGDELDCSKLPEICAALTQVNPVGVRNPEIFYTAKMKELLFDSFAGLTASEAWSGRKKLTGGYIDVNKDGEMLYYRAISDDIFCNYLLANTYFDRPDRGFCFKLALEQAKAYLDDRSLTTEEKNAIIYKNGIDGAKNSKKGHYGFVYCMDGEYYIDINFQIRFR